MLSLHEGFGLVGWEAIAAEVPLIVSKNSGLYEAIDNLLGGIGTGCVTAVEILGSTGEESFQPEDVKAVSEAIIRVRSRGSKAKQDARALKRFLRTFCTWRYTASSLAEACSLHVNENPANIKIARWRPEVLLDALTHSPDMVEEVARRKYQFERIWDRMKPPSAFKERLILFGGIASSLCNQTAADHYTNWLVKNPKANLYVCYESGAAAIARARKLNEGSLETESGLSKDARMRMKEKEKKVLRLRNLIINNTNNTIKGTATRIHFIPLRAPLTTYIMVADTEVYITPLFETRSTETLSFALSARPPQFRQDVFSFIIYHLKILEHSEAATSLIEELQRDISKDSDL